MLIIGIDPGKFGALAFMDGSDGDIIKISDMPISGKEIDKYKLLEILEPLKGFKNFVLIEKCQYTPAIKGPGAYQFGKNVAIVETIVATLKLKHDFVRPQVWKKDFELIKKDKSASILKAKELFPEWEKYFLKSKDGRAEACLLAEYARRKNLGGK